MKKILNLTQHKPTPEQRSAGVVDWPEPIETEEGLDHLSQDAVREMMIFDVNDIVRLGADANKYLMARARTVALEASIAADKVGAEVVMMGCAPFFQIFLMNCLSTFGLSPVWSMTNRESKEIALENGTVKKTNVFKHVGFFALG